MRPADRQRQAANVLGALAVTVADQVSAATAAAAGHSASAAAALSALHEFLAPATLDDVRQVIGLTPSGAVRLVDRLEADGLVRRAPGSDRRSRAVTLTAAGRRAAASVAEARRGVLELLMAGLSVAEVEALESLLGRAMANLVAGKQGGAWICRLCDLDACGRPDGECPAANAAREKYG